MRTFIIALTLLFASATAQADGTVCDGVSRLAENIMSARQRGVPMAQLLGVAAQGDNEPLNELTRTIVIDAYQTSRYNTERIQERTIGDFRDKWMLQCVRELDNG